MGKNLIIRGEKGRIIGIRATHGMRKTRFYAIWTGINTRCSNKKALHYPRYGGRGIKNLWKSFEEFRDDMYESYLAHVKEFGEKQTQIDRIDFNGHYCKENCRFVNLKQQARNTRNNRIIEFQESSFCIAEWEEQLGFNPGTIKRRLYCNWPIKRALTESAYRGKNQFSKRT